MVRARIAWLVLALLFAGCPGDDPPADDDSADVGDDDDDEPIGDALLLDRGLLGDYFAALEEAAYQLGARCREAARQHAPGLELSVYVPGFANTWFYQGLLRGMGAADQPVLLLTYEGWSDRPNEALRAEGVEMVHLGGTIVSHWLPGDFDDVLVDLATGNDGYWYFTFNDFSATNGAPPALHGSSAEYWDAVDEAHDELQR